MMIVVIDFNDRMALTSGGSSIFLPLFLAYCELVMFSATDSPGRSISHSSILGWVQWRPRSQTLVLIIMCCLMASFD